MESIGAGSTGQVFDTDKNRQHDWYIPSVQSRDVVNSSGVRTDELIIIIISSVECPTDAQSDGQIELIIAITSGDVASDPAVGLENKSIDIRTTNKIGNIREEQTVNRSFIFSGDDPRVGCISRNQLIVPGTTVNSFNMVGDVANVAHEIHAVGDIDKVGPYGKRQIVVHVTETHRIIRTTVGELLDGVITPVFVKLKSVVFGTTNQQIISLQAIDRVFTCPTIELVRTAITNN